MNAVFGTSGYKYGEEMRPKKKKKMFFSKNPTISEGEGGKLGALGEVIQAKKKSCMQVCFTIPRGPCGTPDAKIIL